MSDADGLIRRIKSLRAEIGWDQYELAERAGVSKSTVKNIESGANLNPKQETLNSIAGALGCHPRYLLFGEPVKSDSSYDDNDRLSDLEARIEALEASQSATGHVSIPADLVEVLAKYTDKDWNFLRKIHDVPMKKAKASSD